MMADDGCHGQAVIIKVMMMKIVMVIVIGWNGR